MTLLPQWGQKGSAGSTAFAHRGHATLLPSGDVRIGGMSAPEPTAAPGMGASAGTAPVIAPTMGEPDEWPGTLRAADAEIGFPQSMQKRDIGSFSRPQKAQETRGVNAR
ncbi:MAG: hypothetical protein ABI625_13425 [bacterium]